ncbi:hypothetical protein Hanom_Chr04g00347191 [Helianthus anomalus]
MMNLTAPMQPITATAENQVAITIFRITMGLEFLGIFPAFKCAKTGNTKSSGVNPMAPQMDTKSPKNGMAAATKVIKPMYIEVNTSRRKWFLIEVCLLGVIFSSNKAYVGLQYI